MTCRHLGLETPCTRTSCTRHGLLFAGETQTAGAIRDGHEPVEQHDSVESNTLKPIINNSNKNVSNTGPSSGWGTEDGDLCRGVPPLLHGNRFVTRWDGVQVEDEWPDQPLGIVQPMRCYGPSGLCREWVTLNRERISSRCVPEYVVMRLALRAILSNRLPHDLIDHLVTFCATPSLYYYGKWGHFLIRRTRKSGGAGNTKKSRKVGKKWVMKDQTASSTYSQFSADALKPRTSEFLVSRKSITSYIDFEPRLGAYAAFAPAIINVITSIGAVGCYTLTIFDCSIADATLLNCALVALTYYHGKQMARPSKRTGCLFLNEVCKANGVPDVNESTSDAAGTVRDDHGVFSAILHAQNHFIYCTLEAVVHAPVTEAPHVQVPVVQDSAVSYVCTAPSPYLTDLDFRATSMVREICYYHGPFFPENWIVYDELVELGEGPVQMEYVHGPFLPSPDWLVFSEARDQIIAGEILQRNTMVRQYFHEGLFCAAATEEESVLRDQITAVAFRFLAEAHRFVTQLISHVHLSSQGASCGPLLGKHPDDTVVITKRKVVVPAELVNAVEAYVRDHASSLCLDKAWINDLDKHIRSRMALMPPPSGGSSWLRNSSYSMMVDACVEYGAKTVLPRVYQEHRRLLPSWGQAVQMRIRESRLGSFILRVANVDQVAPFVKRWDEDTFHATLSDNSAEWEYICQRVTADLPQRAQVVPDQCIDNDDLSESPCIPHAEMAVKQSDTCFKCGEVGHRAKQCPKNRKRGGARRLHLCRVCQQRHSPRCPYSLNVAEGGGEPNHSHGGRPCGLEVCKQKAFLCPRGHLCQGPCPVCRDDVGVLHSITDHVPIVAGTGQALVGPLVTPSMDVTAFSPAVEIGDVTLEIGPTTNGPRKFRGPTAYLPFSSRRFPVSIDCSRFSVLASLVTRQAAPIPPVTRESWFDLEIWKMCFIHNYRLMPWSVYFNMYSGERRLRIIGGVESARASGWSAVARDFRRFDVFPKFELLSKARATTDRRDVSFLGTVGHLMRASKVNSKGRYLLSVEAFNSVEKQGPAVNPGSQVKPRNISHQGAELNAYTGRQTQSAYWALHSQWNVYDALAVIGFETGLSQESALLELAPHTDFFAGSRIPGLLKIPFVLGSGRDNHGIGRIFEALVLLETAGWVTGELDYSVFDASQGEAVCAAVRYWANHSGLGYKWSWVHLQHQQAKLCSRYGDRLKRVGTLKSGVPYTTLQNSVVNVYAICHAAKSIIGDLWRTKIFVAVAGDDMVAAIAPEYADVFWTQLASKTLELGFKAKVKRRDTCHLGFLASNYWHDGTRYVGAPELARCLYKAPWSLLSQERPHEWVRGVVAGLAHSLSPVPYFGSWALAAAKGRSSTAGLNEQWKGTRAGDGADRDRRNLDLMLRRYPNFVPGKLNPFLGGPRLLPHDSPIDRILTDGGYDIGDDP